MYNITRSVHTCKTILHCKLVNFQLDVVRFNILSWLLIASVSAFAGETVLLLAIYVLLYIISVNVTSKNTKT